VLFFTFTLTIFLKGVYNKNLHLEDTLLKGRVGWFNKEDCYRACVCEYHRKSSSGSSGASGCRSHLVWEDNLGAGYPDGDCYRARPRANFRFEQLRRRRLQDRHRPQRSGGDQIRQTRPGDRLGGCQA